jgi:SpoVK/Ycf46/Vps4 family AAA+-type ATPase
MRKVIEFVENYQIVTLVDEFDSVGKSRVSGHHDIGEYARITNALLQQLDAHSGRALLIAATNIQSELDAAVWRRFDEVLTFNHTSSDQLPALVSNKLAGIEVPGLGPGRIKQIFAGMSPADIERVIFRARKMAVLAGGPVSLETISAAKSAESERGR